MYSPAAPHRVIGDAKGNVRAIEIVKTRLGEYDSSGRRKPVATDEIQRFDCDSVIFAVGETVDLASLRSWPAPDSPPFASPGPCRGTRVPSAPSLCDLLGESGQIAGDLGPLHRLELATGFVELENRAARTGRARPTRTSPCRGYRSAAARAQLVLQEQVVDLAVLLKRPKSRLPSWSSHCLVNSRIRSSRRGEGDGGSDRCRLPRSVM